MPSVAMIHPRRVLCPLILAGSATCSTLAGAADILGVELGQTHTQVGDRIEARVQLAREYDNPFDPQEIVVDAIIALPSGSTLSVPAFWNRDTTRALVNGREVISATGAGYFQLRYAPLETGTHQITFVAEDSFGKSTSSMTEVDVAPRAGKGFVRIDSVDPFALAHDDGSAYVPVGANLCWSTDPSAGYDMEAYLEALAQSGGTWTRLWLTHFGEGWTIEWGADHPSGLYQGLGRYSVEAASRLDRVFETAESKGVAIQLVLWQHSQLEADMWSSWTDNPYNQANGGPAADSRAFFEDPRAVQLSQRRLRYLVARYGAYRSLLAWEIMNEMEGVKAPFDVVAQWCAARATELRALDSHQHLVTTSHMLRPYLAPPTAYESDVYDISQTHAYGGSFSFAIPKDATALRAYGKPPLFAEFGLDFTGEVELDDPRGVHLAEGSWIALASGYWGGAMSWWWDSYLRPNDLFSAQRGFATFVRHVELRGMNEPVGEETFAEDRDGIPLEVFGRTGNAGTFLYVRHPDARWEVASSHALPVVSGATVSLQCPTVETCTATFYDTGTGDPLNTAEVTEGSLPLPEFVGSLAIVLRAGVHSEVPSGDGGCAFAAPVRSRAHWEIVVLLACVVLRRRR